MKIANTPETPYYAVIFTSLRNGENKDYEAMSRKMEELLEKQPGFLGFESAKEEIGITVSYWESIESIQNWKKNADHLEAQVKGKTDWYKNYSVRIAKVERAYSFGEN